MRALLLSATLVSLCACGSRGMSSDSKSNWLRQCISAKQCGEGLSCTCGVCTKSCASAADCGDDAGGSAVCANPADPGLAASCLPMSKAAPKAVCLRSCVDNGQCGKGQRCLHSLCVGAPMTDAGLLDAALASPDAATFHSTPAPPPGSTDGSARTQPPQPQPDDDAGSVASCFNPGCPDGLVCHVNETCAVPGSDGHGVATLAAASENDQIVTADAEFVYGLHFANADGSLLQLVRWPTAGGAMQVMAQGATFLLPRPSFGAAGVLPPPSAPVPLVVDQDHLYFVASANVSELSASLFSMPKDDSAPPTRHGTAGSLLVQDQDRLYFSNDGDSRVLRMQKSMLGTSAAPELIYTSTSDAPGAVVGIAVNSAAVAVVELAHPRMSSSQYTIQRVDKASKAATVLATSDKLTTGPGPVWLDDNYLVMGDRLDLATLEVKPLPVWGPTAFAAGDLITGYGGTFGWGVSVVHVANATRTNLLTRYKLASQSVAATPGTVYLIAQIRSSAVYILVRVVLSP